MKMEEENIKIGIDYKDNHYQFTSSFCNSISKSKTFEELVCELYREFRQAGDLLAHDSYSFDLEIAPDVRNQLNESQLEILGAIFHHKNKISGLNQRLSNLKRSIREVLEKEEEF